MTVAEIITQYLPLMILILIVPILIRLYFETRFQWQPLVDLGGLIDDIKRADSDFSAFWMREEGNMALEGKWISEGRELE